MIVRYSDISARIWILDPWRWDR